MIISQVSYRTNGPLVGYLVLWLIYKRNVDCFQLSLVDLAGSERVGKTGATADQLKVML